MRMNEYDIDRALEVVRQHAPEFFIYVKYLSDWRDIINQNSDGWAYWSAGTRPASNLEDLISKLMHSISGRNVEEPSVKEFYKALTPIKSFATRHKLPAPVLGGGGSGGSVKVTIELEVKTSASPKTVAEVIGKNLEFGTSKEAFELAMNGASGDGEIVGFEVRPGRA